MELIRRVKELGPVQAFRRERYRRCFESQAGYALHFGVFRSFAEAAASAPRSTGFNHALQVTELEDRAEHVFPYDYPVLFWLAQSLAGAASFRLIDIGGHVGVHYYGYRRYLQLPPALEWRVVEVEVIARAGRERAARLGASGLEFATTLTLDEAAPADAVLSAGALHYIERPVLEEALAAAPARSRRRHILLNKLPLYDGEDFVSLQNIGRGSFSPHHVWNRQRFVERFHHLGYEVVDEWLVPERRFALFDDPHRSFGEYRGLYLRQR